MTEGRRESIEFVKQSMVERLFILQTIDKKLSGGLEGELEMLHEIKKRFKRVIFKLTRSLRIFVFLMKDLLVQ